MRDKLCTPMLTADFDYRLPPELIAQEPLPERDRARMLILDRVSGAIEHGSVRDLPDRLRPGDMMVVNDTRVIPARLFGSKAATGGRVELLLVEPLPDDCWKALCKVSGRPRAGDCYRLASGRIDAVVQNVAGDGSVKLLITVAGKDGPAAGPMPMRGINAAGTGAHDAVMAMLETEGATPLPPYIRRPRPAAHSRLTEQTIADRKRYQTIYARAPGAVAAPTAGLHFTPKLFAALERRGVQRVAVTLHTGPGTFQPVTAERVDDHVMQSERYQITPQTAERIEFTRRAGGRILAVGSTTVRTLEHVAAANEGCVTAATGRADLFIRPGFRFRVTDMMLTNFHLPRSTLLMMVAALAGRDRILAAYREAVQAGYRFYSYGDCMLIV